MLRKFAAVLIAATMFTAPALAAGNTSVTTTTPAAKVAAHNTVKVKKHRAHKVKVVKHVKHVRHVSHAKKAKAIKHSAGATVRG